MLSPLHGFEIFSNLRLKIYCRQYNIIVQGRVRGRGAQPGAGQGEGGCDPGQAVRVHQAGLRPPQVQLHGDRHALPLARVHQTKLQEEYSVKNQY